MNKCLLKLCAHRALDGQECKAPAMRQSDYCRHHRRVHRPAVVFPAYVLAITNRRELQAALQRTFQDLWTGAITPKFGGQIVRELSKHVYGYGGKTRFPADGVFEAARQQCSSSSTSS